jgi:hypothetical protein
VGGRFTFLYEKVMIFLIQIEVIDISTKLDIFFLHNSSPPKERKGGGGGRGRKLRKCGVFFSLERRQRSRKEGGGKRGAEEGS